MTCRARISFALSLLAFASGAFPSQAVAQASPGDSAVPAPRGEAVWRVSGRAVPGLEGFDTTMRRYMLRLGISAGSLAVVKDGRLVLSKGYTFAPEGADDVAPGAGFRIASLSKPLTAVGVLRLVDAGALELDQRLASVLDMTAWADERAREITIRQLLQHRAGFDRRASFDPMFQDQRISEELDRPLPTDPSMVIEFMAARPLDFDPGARYAYSNFGYALLGRVIEAVSKRGYEEFIREDVLRPIGADGMRVGDSRLDRRLPGEVSYDHDGEGRSVMGDGGSVPIVYGAFNMATMDAHGGWVASATDLARFLAAFDEGVESPLLRAATRRAMWANPDADSSPGVHYGLGWSVRRRDDGSINTWHTGSLPGTWTLMVRRHDGIHFVALFNKRSGNSGQIDGALHRAIHAVSEWPAHDLFRE